MPKSLQTFQDLESDLNLVESQLGELEDLMHWSDPAGETTDEHVHSFDFGIEQQLIELTHELDEFEPRFQPEPSDPYWAPTRRSGQQESEKKFNERPDRFPNNSSSNRPLQNIDASTQLPLSGKSQNKDSK